MPKKRSRPLTAEKPAQIAVHPELGNLIRRRSDVVAALREFGSASLVEQNHQELALRSRLKAMEVLGGLSIFVLPQENRLAAAASLSPKVDPRQASGLLADLRGWENLLLRLFREEQGYLNEITAISTRPEFFLKAREPVLHLEFYSFSRRVFESNQPALSVAQVLTGCLLALVNLMESLPKEAASRALKRDATEFENLRKACAAWIDKSQALG